MKERKWLLVPKVNHMEQGEGWLSITAPLGLKLPKDLAELGGVLEDSWGEAFRIDGRGDNDSRGDLCAGAVEVAFQRSGELPDEGYVLEIHAGSIHITYAGAAGAFYGLMTLRQLMAFDAQGAPGPALPCCLIQDAPLLALRGYMLDIGRGKVPTLQTLKETADLLASLKYNHLELYIEGMPFAYPSFQEHWQDKTPLTPEEIKEFAFYCRQRFLDLAPNQNSLGHMAGWLACPELKCLAEKEEGFVIQGIPAPPTTLDCRDPRSLAFVEKLMDDLLPCFASELFHVGLDEPFELGQGKNRELAQRVGEQKLYMDYVNQIHEAVVRRGKTMMMWGDIVAKEPESAALLPEDVILMEWGYEAGHPFAKRAGKLREMGRRFCLCPGTSAWHSIGGITDNMMENVRQAAAAAHEYGAFGLLLTDWGDGGHLQYWPVSWPAIALAGALAWNGKDFTEEELAAVLDRFLFKDPAGKMGAAALNVGRYYHREEFPLGCRTMATLPLALGPLRGEEKWEKLLQTIVAITARMTPPEVSQPFLQAASRRKPFRPEEMDEWQTELLARLKEARPSCPHGDLVKEEFINAIALVNCLTHSRAVLMADKEDAALAGRLYQAVEKHRSLWLARNKVSSLEEGAGKLESVAKALERRTS